MDIFIVILFLFGIWLHYPNFDSSHLFKKDAKKSWIKFLEKIIWVKWLQHFLLALFHWVLGFFSVFVIVFVVIRLILMSFCWLVNKKSLFFTLRPYVEYLLNRVESHWIYCRWYLGFSQRFRCYKIIFHIC